MCRYVKVASHARECHQNGLLTCIFLNESHQLNSIQQTNGQSRDMNEAFKLPKDLLVKMLRSTD